MHSAATTSPATGRVAVTCAILGTAAAGAWWLHGHAPSAGSWYPPCFFHALTGLHCPGCGATRAVYALLHGRVTDALHQNALAVVALPFIGVAVARSLWRWTWGLPPPLQPNPGRWALRITLLLAPLVILFGVVRNLPWSPFNLLAPY